MAPPVSPKEFVDLLRRSQLLNTRFMQRIVEQVDSLRSESQAEDGVEAARRLASGLVKAKVISLYQAQQLLAGRYKGFYLGKYKLLEILGRGGMGKVYLAEQVSMQRLVAVKIVRTARKRKSDVLQRFAREARAVAALNHSNIIRAFDYDETGDTPYIVMEFVEGIDVQRQVGKLGPLTAGQAADYVRQAAAGLEHAFQSGLVHRDIKPGNLLVDTRGVVKLLDLGLVGIDNSNDSLTNDAEPLGTVDYVAPEQAAHSSTADIRADIYSLGAVLHFMLTGKILFPNRSTSEKLVALQTEDPVPTAELAGELPEGLSAVIAKMIAKTPEARYQTPQEVIDAVTPFASAVTPPYDLSAVKHLRADMLELLRRSPPLHEIGDPQVLAELTGSDTAQQAADSDSGSVSQTTPEDQLSAAGLTRDGADGDEDQDEIDSLINLLIEEEELHASREPISNPVSGAASAAEGVASDFKLALQTKTRNRAPKPTIRPSEDGPITERITGGDAPPGDYYAPQRTQNWKTGLLATVLVGGTSLAICVASVLSISNWISGLTPTPPAEGNPTRGAASAPEVAATAPAEAATGSTKPAAFDPLAEIIAPPELSPPAGARSIHPTSTAAVVDGVFGDPRRQHFNRVTAISVTTSGMIATASTDQTIRIWDGEGKLLHTLQWGGAVVNALAFSPDGSTLCGGDESGELTAWAPGSGQELWRRDVSGPVTTISFSNNGEFLAVADGSETAQLYETSTGKPQKSFVYSQPPRCVAFSPVAARLAVMLQDGSVVVRDVETKATLLQTRTGAGEARCLAFNSAGDLAAIADEDRQIVVWPAAVFARAENKLTDAAVDDLTQKVALPRTAQTLAWRGPDLLQAACGSGIYSFKVTGLLMTDEIPAPLWGHRTPVRCLATAGDGQKLLVSADDAGGVHVWRFTEASTADPPHTISRFHIAASGRVLYAGGFNHIQQWSTDSLKQTTAFGRFPGFAQTLSVSEEGNLLAASGGFENVAQIWDTRSGWQRARIDAGGRVMSLSLRGDQNALVAGVQGKGCSLFSTHTNQSLMSFEDSQYAVNSLTVSPSLQWLAASGSENVVVWNARTGDRVLTLETAGAPAVCRFSPTREILAAGGSQGKVKLFRMPGGEAIGELAPENPIALRSLSFDASGDFLATCGDGPTVCIWNLPAKQCVVQLSLGPPGAQMHQVQFSPGGKHLFILAGNGVIYRVRSTLPEELPVNSDD